MPTLPNSYTAVLDPLTCRLCLPLCHTVIIRSYDRGLTSTCIRRYQHHWFPYVRWRFRYVTSLSSFALFWINNETCPTWLLAQLSGPTLDKCLVILCLCFFQGLCSNSMATGSHMYISTFSSVCCFYFRTVHKISGYNGGYLVTVCSYTSTKRNPNKPYSLNRRYKSKLKIRKEQRTVRIDECKVVHSMRQRLSKTMGSVHDYQQWRGTPWYLPKQLLGNGHLIFHTTLNLPLMTMRCASPPPIFGLFSCLIHGLG